jgi:uncharacterized membrane protein HdeD (DUF308 family)
MNEQTISPNRFQMGRSIRQKFEDRPGWLYFIGATHILVGTVALLMPFVASLAVEITIGVLLTISGCFYAYKTIISQRKTQAATNFLLCLFSFGVGISFLAVSGLGRLSLATLAAVLFLVIGGGRIAETFSSDPIVGRGWLILSAVMNLALGGLILFGLPGSAFWMLGILLGVDFLFIGFHMVGLGLEVSRKSPQAVASAA